MLASAPPVNRDRLPMSNTPLPPPPSPQPLAPPGPPLSGPAPSGWGPPPGPVPQADAWHAPPPTGAPPPLGPPPSAPPPGWGATSQRPANKGCATFAIAAVALTVLGFGALLALALLLPSAGRAELTHLAIVQPTGNATFVEATIVVSEYPAAGESLTDFVVVLESEALRSGELRFDWNWIASKDDQPGSTSGAPPPLETPMSVRFLIERELVDQVTLYDNEALKLHARIEWVGNLVFSEALAIRHLYEN